jgi:hypothetical protein
MASPATPPSSSSSPRKDKGKGKGKSRHELVSEAHIAYMQHASLYSSSSSSSLSLPFASTWTDGCNGRCVEEEEEEGEGEGVLSSSPFESLCHELRRVEESMCRYLRVRVPHPHRTAVAGEPPGFYY